MREHGFCHHCRSMTLIDETGKCEHCKRAEVYKIKQDPIETSKIETLLLEILETLKRLEKNGR